MGDAVRDAIGVLVPVLVVGAIVNAGPVVGAIVGLSMGFLFLLLPLALIVWHAARERRAELAENARVARCAPPSGNGALYDWVWTDYMADTISLVSALIRVDELVAARVAQVSDWQQVDVWSTPLAPSGDWGWNGDRLVHAMPIARVARRAV